MARLDFSPFVRSSIGFDSMFDLLNRAAMNQSLGDLPPYNIERIDDDAYRITLAVAGYAEDDLEIELKNQSLTVSGRLHSADTKNQDYLHRGIQSGNFKNEFHLAEHVKVLGASLENGLLYIDLVREVPEEKKPKRIDIRQGAPQNIVSKLKKSVGINDKAKAA